MVRVTQVMLALLQVAINPYLGALGPAAEQRWLAKQHCFGGAALRAESRKDTTVQGIALDKVRVRCTGTSYSETLYFALTSTVPHPPTVTAADVRVPQMRAQA